MNERYLWDLGGEPDAEVARLETALLPFRHRGREFHGARARVSRVRLSPYRLAAAAALLVAAAAITLAPAPGARETAWQVAAIQGGPRLGNSAAAISMPLREGQTLRTGSASALSLQAGDVGRIEIGPDSELRADTDLRLQLRRGLLHARIWAPPRRFVVDTPSARAVDLGCEYTIAVTGAGDGLLRVSYGWVAFRYGQLESFVPAGAECATRRRQGPGIPYYSDAPPPMKRALAAFENGDAAALVPILRSARPRDALTLWHLLTRVPAGQRGLVYGRLAELTPLPPAVTREKAIGLDPSTIDLCWDALGLENTDWWRGWERRWSE